MQRTQIIAEAGVNHNGSLDLAKKLVDVAAEAGVDVVKFQTFKAKNLISRHTPMAAYQSKTTGKTQSQLDMVQALELDEAAHHALIAHCRTRGIEFLSTPFDFDSLDLLIKRLQLSKVKLGSGEVTNAPFLLAAAQTGRPIILSTGMCTLGEVETALGVLAFGYLKGDMAPSEAAFRKAFCSPEGQAALRAKVSILHCTSEYPAPFADVNLKVMDTLKQAFGLPVGFSDHTPGIAIPIAAVARGATIIERHFTLDKAMPGPDHKASLEPSELKAMVDGIRAVESALGNGQKIPAPSELKNLDVVRRCLVAGHRIARGEAFTRENVGIKRAKGGIPPVGYWTLLGRTATRDYAEDEVIGESL